MTLASARPVRSSITIPGAPARTPNRRASAMPARAVRAGRRASGMEPFPLGIDEHRVADLALDIAAAQRIAGAHPLADPLRPARQQAEADPVAEARRVRHRGHVALVVLGGSGGAERHEMRTGAQPL